MNDQTEQNIADQLLLNAIDFIESTVDNMGDWEASVSAVLACALEKAMNRKLRPLNEIFE